MNLCPVSPGSPESADILEDYLLARHKQAFVELLKDHTTEKNIFWGTKSYVDTYGEGYDEYDEITIEKITGENGNIIQPRAIKDRAVQTKRSKDMAEVFTPSWICNAQNNLIDNAWFEDHGYGGPREGGWFNDDERNWVVNSAPIFMAGDKNWQEYVSDIRLEITCGEAPYLASRYDVADPATDLIPLPRRIGILDRKLRVVNENIPTNNKKEWLEWAKRAVQSVYGYEWQGDNILIARESLLFTFIDYYEAKFGNRMIHWQTLKSIARIISWNIWQMDGLKMVVPGSCHDEVEQVTVPATLWEESRVVEKVKPCPGCKSGDIRAHNGRQCLIRDWEVTRIEDRKKHRNGDKKKSREEEFATGAIVPFVSFIKD